MAAAKTRKKSKKELKWLAELEAAFLKAYDDNADALYRHAYVRVRDGDKAKDIVQEAFAKTWTYLSEGKKIEYIKAFLYRVVNNLIVDGSRRKKFTSLDAMMDEDGFEPRDESIREPVDTPGIARAMKLLSELDPIYRVTITMRYIDGLTPREIAHALSISENVVSVRIYRGMERLKAVINSPTSGA